MKEKFTTDRWEKALTAVFIKSINDPAYRELCLIDPRAAVEVVAPELELPPDFHFRFAAHEKDVHYSYLLPPPLLEDDDDPIRYARKLIEQNTNGLTHPPTNKPDPGPGKGKGGGDSQDGDSTDSDGDSIE